MAPTNETLIVTPLIVTSPVDPLDPVPVETTTGGVVTPVFITENEVGPLVNIGLPLREEGTLTDISKVPTSPGLLFPAAVISADVSTRTS